MWSKELKEFEVMSQEVGNRVDMVQGGGGNTSVKLDDQLMAVKASGFKLNQITSTEGYVVVCYKNIKEYYEQVDINSDADFEKESVEFVKKNIVEIEGIKSLRPSVEAGFHSILKKYVVHTHPVYANILCCAQNGRELADKIFTSSGVGFIWIPYINPGFCLTLKIKEGIDQYVKNTGVFPEIIFMENHGLIVTSDDSRKCLQLHHEVNHAIKQYLRIQTEYPCIKLEQIEEEMIKSRTEYLVNYFKGKNLPADFFDKTVLYPDQLVYLNGSISMEGADKKLRINTETGDLIYRTNYSEALAIEQTLLAYLYVIEGVAGSNLQIKTMTEKEVDFIKNWESESYRKSLVKNLGSAKI